MKKLLALFLICFSFAISAAEVNVADTCVSCNFINGTITGSTVNGLSSTVATGAELNTGTSDTKIVTPKTVADSYYMKPGVLVVNVAGGAATHVVSAANAKALNVEASGAITGDVIVELPVGAAILAAENATTGNFTVSYKITGGSAVVIPRGKKLGVYANGTTFEVLDSRFTVKTMADMVALDPAVVSPYVDAYMVSDYPGAPATLVSNGTKWIAVGYNPTLKLESSPGSSSSTSFNDASIVKSFPAIPAGFLKVGDTIQNIHTLTKNNTTNAQTVATYIGTTGTISGGDTLIYTSTAGVVGAASNMATIGFVYFVILSDTTVGILSGSGNYGTLTEMTRIVPIPSISANNLIISSAVKNDTSNATTVTNRNSQLSVIKQ